ncbi:zinc-dependent alcohol dehydrogenase [Cohnella hashimotonis]|uniref:Alcohol dehydrogenase catalytic domain-containing protein n=1 Tax=Cohnella hashimotonis TaxID=2826895 RepID=A0ABT6TM10_9BACL|nr:alcohol dehydrogenase catalytic domain-containing protein [Cohnella hashimotonis]MDI4647780.1 alcohol dehydrogenase catalytic domain-containing protein [Cohnella hashimotonis]
MKAAVMEQWGSIELRDVSMPELGDNEVLIKVKYAGICGTDLHIYEGHHPTATPPLIPGHEFVGTIERIRASLPTDLREGDRVVAEPLISCGACEACREGTPHVCRSLKLLGIHTNGAFGEYVKASLDKVIRVDDRLPDTIAAMAEPFAVGYHVNRRAGTGRGDRVLIIGGGPIGLIVGLVARERGASMVAFSEINPARLEQVRSFGFEDSIRPATEDPAERAGELTGGEGFDIVIEVSGSQAGMQLATEVCRIRGKVVFVGFPSKQPQVNVLQGIFKELTFIGSRVYTFDDFRATVKLLGRMTADPALGIERLITDICAVEELEASIHAMKEGRSNGKILIGFN